MMPPVCFIAIDTLKDTKRTALLGHCPFSYGHQFLGFTAICGPMGHRSISTLVRSSKYHHGPLDTADYPAL